MHSEFGMNAGLGKKWCENCRCNPDNTDNGYFENYDGRERVALEKRGRQ